MKGLNKKSLKKSFWLVAFAFTFAGAVRAEAEVLTSGCWLTLETSSSGMRQPALVALDSAIKSLRYRPYRNSDARLLDGKGETHLPQEINVPDAIANANNVCASEIFMLDRQINLIPPSLRSPVQVNVYPSAVVYGSDGRVIYNQYLGMTSRRY